MMVVALDGSSVLDHPIRCPPDLRSLEKPRGDWPSQLRRSEVLVSIWSDQLGREGLAALVGGPAEGTFICCLPCLVSPFRGASSCYDEDLSLRMR